MTDEFDALLDSVLIGGREHVTIEVVEYDAGWPARFVRLAEVIGQALGPLALSVDHIGSTSVPGLAAKPIIDILLTVASVEDEDSYLTAMEHAGFVLRVREPDHRMFRTPAKNVHIHLYAPGRQESVDYLTLRDWLRSSAPARALYAETKKRLAGQSWPDMNYYAAAKSGVIAQLLADARAHPVVEPVETRAQG
ncbi:hypothetical protein AL755_13040 [Arthrobacter sp. ERGS1:01]|uniref:GrpB family protein n=1 Tax=Arthrobacter sp. ERGS1:01 TaxID=1704044 RepID=UPI0006B59269|nr:GrpB family protein [Arthrobacter sp. ERGS1:01]ALE06175.1 hypothetical protein AL755_13040 [Arthrobacter sp. ERGS1:01]